MNINAFLLKFVIGFIGGYLLGAVMPVSLLPLTFALAILWGVVTSVGVNKIFGLH